MSYEPNVLKKIKDIEDRKTIGRLMHDIAYHNHRYYVLDDPVITDSEYDNLYREFMTYKKKYPDIPDPIGAPGSNYKVKHVNKMLSLKNSTDINYITDWFESNKSKYSDIHLACEPKMDGLAIELIYNDGVLISSSTRGDGSTGEDIIHNVIHIDGVPTKLNSKDSADIYGEVFLTKDNLKTINIKRRRDGKTPYANSRNAASGIARSQSADHKLLNMLSFYPYRVTHINTQINSYTYFKKNGFTDYSNLCRLCHDADGMISYHDYLAGIRNTLPFDIDGIVFKVNDKAIQNMIGSGMKHPKWALAFKFPAAQATTELLGVKFQVGRTGRITPVGIISPTILGGVTIKRATLSNINVIREKQIMIGDTVLLERAGDVIPAIIKPILEKRTKDAKEIIFPSECPSCHGELTFDGTYHYCNNHLDCKDQIIKQLAYAAGRKALNIKGLGLATADILVNNNIALDIADVFSIDTDATTREYMVETLKMGQKTVDNLCKAIDDARTITFPKLIKCLGINNVSDGIANHIAERFGNLEGLLSDDMLHSKLSAISNISSDTVNDIVDFFNDPEKLDIIDRLFKHGVICQDYVSVDKSKNRVVFTGKFKRSRADLERFVRENIGNVDKRVTKKTTYLVRGEKPGSKVEVANKLGIKILSEDELLNIPNI